VLLRNGTLAMQAALSMGGFGISNAASIDSNGATLTIGNSVAGGVLIGRSGIATTIAGTFVVSNYSRGEWSTTTGVSVVFGSPGTFVQFASANTSSGTDFLVNALPGLQYTGARSRDFRVSYVVSFTVGSAGQNMTFAAGINGTASTPRYFYGANASNAGQTTSCAWSQKVTLNQNDYIQTMMACAAATTINNVISYIFIEMIPN